MKLRQMNLISANSEIAHSDDNKVGTPYSAYGSSVSGDGCSKRVTVSGILSDGEGAFAFTVPHGFLGRDSDVVVDVETKLEIGRLIGDSPREFYQDTIDVQDYISVIKLNETTKVRSNVGRNAYISETVSGAGLLESNVYLQERNGRRLVASIVRQDTGVYISGIGERDDVDIHFVGGIIIRPKEKVERFVSAGDSGLLVTDSKSRAIGIVVACDDELVFVAPIHNALKSKGLKYISPEQSLIWNGEEFKQEKYDTQSVRKHRNYLFTSESVSEGHPDKVCDRISDEIVDLVYREAKKSGVDPWSVRVACETLATTNRVVIAGEVRVPPSLVKKNTEGWGAIDPVKFKSAARKAIRAIGYEQDGFHWKTVKIDILLHYQSAHIAQGVDNASDHQGSEGAGDQGIMFGYACNETPELMPAPIYYSHKMLELLAAARHRGEGDVGKLGPDAKSQVTVRYVDGKPFDVASIVLSTQHLDGSWDSAKVRQVVEPYIREALEGLPIASDCKWYINPTGKFEIGGPDGDAGLTGRKIIVDTYGGAAPHGGGAFSGKDTTKVDRCAAYAARYLAKNVVAAGFSDRCTIQLAYAIGVAQPLSINVNFHGTGKIGEDVLEKVLTKVIDLSPSGIRRHLDLNRPIYAKTSSYGHFGRKPGRDGSFSWEKLDLVKDLRRAVLEFIV